MPTPSGFSIWHIAFRPFFLFASLFVFAALLLWLLVLSGEVGNFQPYSGWFIWHGHEMVFGFVQAIAVGFLLTASRNWTGQPGVSKRFIQILFIVWLLARLGWLWAGIPAWLLASLDVITPLLAAAGLANTLSAGEQASHSDNQSHNWPFVGLLLGLAIFQAIYHYLLYFHSPYIATLQRVAALIMMAMTFWVSGRVVPFFTRLRLKTPVVAIPELLKHTTMTLTWLLVPVYLLQALLQQMGIHEIAQLLEYALALCAVLAVTGHLGLLRLFYQRGVFSEPMLWSLYLAYLWLMVGLLLLALTPWAATPWLHAITMGGLFAMILAMMARISLGHTGRKITALRGMSLVFVAIQCAVVIRLLPDLGLAAVIDHLTAYRLAATLLLVGLATFLYHYLPILLRPRADGKPG
ncbi:NnrS family protein [Bacterioplanoides sp.]|uniref:NnrS family protein n=1 Tax=Bacterioplanoides sp. TaxID=2066072 RepID=UPI003B5A2C07